MSVKQLDTKQGKQGKNQEQTDSRPQVHSQPLPARQLHRASIPWGQEQLCPLTEAPTCRQPKGPSLEGQMGPVATRRSHT